MSKQADVTKIFPQLIHLLNDKLHPIDSRYNRHGQSKFLQLARRKDIGSSVCQRETTVNG